MDYQKILKKVEELQRELMEIPDYSEEVYQAFEATIWELETVIEEGE